MEPEEEEVEEGAAEGGAEGGTEEGAESEEEEEDYYAKLEAEKKVDHWLLRVSMSWKNVKVSTSMMIIQKAMKNVFSFT